MERLPVSEAVPEQVLFWNVTVYPDAYIVRGEPERMYKGAFVERFFDPSSEDHRALMDELPLSAVFGLREVDGQLEPFVVQSRRSWRSGNIADIPLPQRNTWREVYVYSGIFDAVVARPCLAGESFPVMNNRLKLL